MGNKVLRQMSGPLVLPVVSLVLGGLRPVLGWPCATGIAMLVVVSALAYQIRHLHPTASLREHGARLFMAAAAGVMVIDSFTPARAKVSVAVCAFVLALGAAMVSENLKAGGRLLAGASSVLVGISLVPEAVGHWQPVASPVDLACAAVWIAVGVSLLADRHALARGASITFGVVLLAFGVALIIHGQRADGAVLLIVGTVITVIQAAIPSPRVRRGIRDLLTGALFSLVGAALTVFVIISGEQTVLGHAGIDPWIALFVSGVAAMVCGIARMTKWHRVVRAAKVMFAAGILVVGAAFFAADPVIGSAVFLRACALIALVAANIGPEFFKAQWQMLAEATVLPRDVG